MFRQMCKSKLHRLTVTETNLEYNGSITIDSELLQAADILPFEKVQVANLTNGNRLETYAIPGVAGKKDVCLNGAAAHLCNVGDIILVITYAVYSEDELKEFKPNIVLVDEKNCIKN